MRYAESGATKNSPFWTWIANGIDAAAWLWCARNVFCCWRQFFGSPLWPSDLYRRYPGWNLPKLLNSTPPQPQSSSTYSATFCVFTFSLLLFKQSCVSVWAYCTGLRTGFYCISGTKMRQARWVEYLLCGYRTREEKSEHFIVLYISSF